MSPLWILLTLLPVLGCAERFNCKSRILGAYYADAKSGCKAFHVCVRVAGGGVRDFRFFCPPGTLFHQEAQTCTDWGDDDPLACPADIYDGQFDLYRIGSGFDTKKLSSYGNRDDEAEFGLQRAETGDRRLSQNNNVTPNRPDSDLRAAHSSDFFSGQRDRGRDEQSSPASSPSPVSSQQPYQRQSFRRASTQRPYPTTQRTYPTTQRTFPTTQYTTPAPPPNTQPPSPQQQYDAPSKRKLVRKRPIYVSTKAPPTTFQPNTQTQQQYSDPPQQNFNRRFNAQNKESFSPSPNVPPQYKQYKDEYVEVPRVTPKQNNRFYPSSAPSTFPQSQSTAAPRFNKKDGLVELYNYDAQSTPGINVQNDNRPFKVRNSFNVADVPRDPEFVRAKNFNNYNKRVENNNRENFRDTPTTIDYSVSARTFPTTTPAYKNFNSVSYEPEKNNFVPYSKQAYFNNPTTTVAPATTIYSTSRPEPPLNLNTVAYNTNLAFNTQSENFAEDNDEDDGQYHPPQGEDDGQYRPDLYGNRELLAGAHSLNIAASGNRLPEDRKTYAKTQPPPKPSSQTSSPRPFRPAPTTPPSTRAPETTYTTTPQPQTVNTQRTFDYFQTYTTTSRPVDFQAINQNFQTANDAPAAPTTTVAPRVPETRPPRPPSRVPVPPSPPTAPPTPVARPTTRPPHFANPPRNKEDNSYDYAYYDSDPGFTEYDHIEEFGRTKTRA